MRQHKNIEHRWPPASTWVARLKPAAAALPLGQMRRGLAPGNHQQRAGFPPATAPPDPAARSLCSSHQPSELLQAAVQFPFAPLTSPGSAFGAKSFQVFFKVLVVHGAVALGLAEALGKEKLVSPQRSETSPGPGSSHSDNGLQSKKKNEPTGLEQQQEPHTRRS